MKEKITDLIYWFQYNIYNLRYFYYQKEYEFHNFIEKIKRINKRNLLLPNQTKHPQYIILMLSYLNMLCGKMVFT